ELIEIGAFELDLQRYRSPHVSPGILHRQTSEGPNFSSFSSGFAIACFPCYTGPGDAAQELARTLLRFCGTRARCAAARERGLPGPAAGRTRCGGSRSSARLARPRV